MLKQYPYIFKFEIVEKYLTINSNHSRNTIAEPFTRISRSRHSATNRTGSGRKSRMCLTTWRLFLWNHLHRNRERCWDWMSARTSFL
jgi:hypothetical protein